MSSLPRPSILPWVRVGTPRYRAYRRTHPLSDEPSTSSLLVHVPSRVPTSGTSDSLPLTEAPPVGTTYGRPPTSRTPVSTLPNRFPSRNHRRHSRLTSPNPHGDSSFTVPTTVLTLPLSWVGVSLPSHSTPVRTCSDSISGSSQPPNACRGSTGRRIAP